MISIKPGVKLYGLQPQMLVALISAHDLLASYGVDCVITSGSEGQHSEHSKHYMGMATDIRTRDLTDEAKTELRDRLQEALGRDFLVVLESTHLHMEYRPKADVQVV